MGNQDPEAHLILQAFRALTRLAAPGLLLKAEAMVAPELLGGYLGNHEVYRPECDLAYDNQLMVMLWSSMATGDARLATRALSRRPPPPDPTSWVSYLRCHDDIGWAVSDLDAEAVGLDGPGHRRQLSDFYAGKVAGSFARGEVFQVNPSGASPISGMLASLCGVQVALAGGDPIELELALRRLESMYSVAFSFGGIPLVYMGDELAMMNDLGFADEPGHGVDNRWLHRPRMDWSLAQRRTEPASVPGRAHAALRALATARRGQPSLRSNATTRLVDGPDRQLLSYLRCAPGQPPVLAVVNVGRWPQPLDPAIEAAGFGRPVL
ncbi:MAG: alpha-amylase, partial [Jatrophihabitantaceae bacterium]